MAHPKPNDILTFADAATIDADDAPGELDAGRWDPVTRSNWRHGVVVGNIVFALKLWARDNPGWQVATADPGVKLDNDPDVLRGPDVGVVREDRSPTGLGEEGWLLGAPDVVDPQAEQVAIYRPGNIVELVREGQVDASDVLPGFMCPLTDIFG